MATYTQLFLFFFLKNGSLHNLKIQTRATDACHLTFAQFSYYYFEKATGILVNFALALRDI